MKKKRRKREKSKEHRRKAGLLPQWPGEWAQPRTNQRRRGCDDSLGGDIGEDQTTPEEDERK